MPSLSHAPSQTEPSQEACPQVSARSVRITSSASDWRGVQVLLPVCSARSMPFPVARVARRHRTNYSTGGNQNKLSDGHGIECLVKSILTTATARHTDVVADPRRSKSIVVVSAGSHAAKRAQLQLHNPRHKRKPKPPLAWSALLSRS